MGGMDDSASDGEHYESANEALHTASPESSSKLTNKTAPKTTSPKKRAKKAKKRKSLSFSSDEEDVNPNITPEDDFSFTRTPKAKKPLTKTTARDETAAKIPAKSTPKKASSLDASGKTPSVKETTTETTIEKESELPSKEEPKKAKKAKKRVLTFDSDSDEAELEQTELEPVERVKKTLKEKKGSKEKATTIKPVKERAPGKTKFSTNGVAARGHKRAIDITADRRRTISTEYKTGPLTPEEAKSLNSAIGSYKRRNELDDHGFARRVWDSNKQRYDNIWTELCAALPERSRPTVYRRIRNMFPLYEKREWTEEDEDELIQLYGLMPGNWRQIGDQLDRNAEDVRDRWRNHIFFKGKPRKTGKDSWDEEDMEELKDIVRDSLVALGKLNEGDDPRDFTITDAGLTLAMVAQQTNRDRLQISWKWRAMQMDRQKEKATGVKKIKYRKTKSEMEAERAAAVKSIYDVSDSDVGSDVDLNATTEKKRKRLETNEAEDEKPRAQKTSKRQKGSDAAPQEATPEPSPEKETSDRAVTASKTPEVAEPQLEDFSAPQHIPKITKSTPSKKASAIDTTEVVEVPSSQPTELTEKERRRLEKRERKRQRKEKKLSEIKEVPETQSDTLATVASPINKRKYVDTEDIEVEDATKTGQDELTEKERRRNEKKERKRRKKEIEAQSAQFAAENSAKSLESQDAELEDATNSLNIKEKKKNKKHFEKASTLEITETQLVEKPDVSPKKVLSKAELTPEEEAQRRREKKQRKAQRASLVAAEA